MQARRSLTFLAAVLITLGQALIFAVDTSASTPAADASVATVLQLSATSADV